MGPFHNEGRVVVIVERSRSHDILQGRHVGVLVGERHHGLVGEVRRLLGKGEGVHVLGVEHWRAVESVAALGGQVRQLGGVPKRLTVLPRVVLVVLGGAGPVEHLACHSPAVHSVDAGAIAAVGLHLVGDIQVGRAPAAQLQARHNAAVLGRGCGARHAVNEAVGRLHLVIAVQACRRCRRERVAQRRGERADLRTEPVVLHMQARLPRLEAI